MTGSQIFMIVLIVGVVILFAVANKSAKQDEARKIILREEQKRLKREEQEKWRRQFEEERKLKQQKLKELEEQARQEGFPIPNGAKFISLDDLKRDKYR